jgi:hypothetical protein
MSEIIVGPNRIFKALDQVLRYAALGLRFLDQTFDEPVADGLLVTARPLRGRGAPIPAALNGEGIHVFARLPGVPDDLAAGAGAPSVDYIIEVWDRLGRFLPIATTVTLPAADNLKTFYLFSAPTRAVTTAIGAIRGLLRDTASGQPAAYAVLEAEESGKKWYGIADGQGSVLVTFPYPNFQKSATNPPSSQKLLINQAWTYTVRARYRPGAQAPLPGAAVPDLKTILGQAACTITTSSGPPAVVVSQFTVAIRFGQTSVVRTGAQPFLLLTPGSSPP